MTASYCPGVRKLTVVALFACAILSFNVASALAGPGLIIGVNDDAPKWQESPTTIQQVENDLGFSYYRVSLSWNPGQTDISATDQTVMTRAVRNADGKHLLLNVFGKPDSAPQDDSTRQTFCTYVSNVVGRFATISAVNIWNEVNKASYWRPQFNADGTPASPAAYERLMETCYATIKAAHPDVLVLTSVSPRGNDNPTAASNVSISPANFITDMGLAYKADAHSGRIFDEWGQNVYGENSSERPWKSHPGNTDIAEGDYSRLMNALSSAFSGTGQPVPGTNGVTIWYLETGYQTQIDSTKSNLYTGTENDAHPLVPVASNGDIETHPADTSPAPDQGTQLVDAIRLAYCQPAVGAFFNFMLADESNLAGWQSGVLWADWTPKPSYGAFKSVISEVNSGSVNCSQLKGGSEGITVTTPVKPSTKPVSKPATKPAAKPAKKVAKPKTKKPAKKATAAKSAAGKPTAKAKAKKPAKHHSPAKRR